MPVGGVLGRTLQSHDDLPGAPRRVAVPPKRQVDASPPARSRTRSPIVEPACTGLAPGAISFSACTGPQTLNALTSIPCCDAISAGLHGDECREEQAWDERAPAPLADDHGTSPPRAHQEINTE